MVEKFFWADALVFRFIYLVHIFTLFLNDINSRLIQLVLRVLVSYRLSTMNSMIFCLKKKNSFFRYNYMTYIHKIMMIMIMMIILQKLRYFDGRFFNRVLLFLFYMCIFFPTKKRKFLNLKFGPYYQFLSVTRVFFNHII